MLINKRGVSYFILLHSSRLLKRKYLSYPAIPISPRKLRIIKIATGCFFEFNRQWLLREKK